MFSMKHYTLARIFGQHRKLSQRQLFPKNSYLTHNVQNASMSNYFFLRTRRLYPNLVALNKKPYPKNKGKAELKFQSFL